MQFAASLKLVGQAVKFELIDKVIEQSPDRIVAIKMVTKAEEYLQDHFPDYPILPGVLMIESLVQAARIMLAGQANDARLVLGEVRALRYGSFVRPGEALRVEVWLTGREGDAFKCKGTGVVIHPGAQELEPETAVSGRFTMRPVRLPT